MSVYWSGRDGTLPPPNAIFSFLPFTGPFQSISLKQVSLPPPERVKVRNRTFLPSKLEWIKNIEKALKLIEENDLQKVVLARAIRVELDHAPNPFAIAAALPREGAYHFCILLGSKAFLGASPERLFKREARTIFSEALAATRPRGKTAAEDNALAQDLLNTKKDRLEFSFVQDYVRDTLSCLCETVTFTPITIHKTQNVQHLYSQATGVLKEGVTDEEILSKLHPTPALCGTPKSKALSLIKELEPFDRDLYGGVLGWHTPDASEYIVGIRSCSFKENIATLFSGTGIVHGSQGEKEWEELNQKVKLYDTILVD